MNLVRGSVGFLHLGFFENFASHDTVLCEGDDQGLQRLVSALRSLETGLEEKVALDTLPGVKIRGKLRLHAARGPRDRFVRDSADDFRWETTEGGWTEAVEKIEVLFETAAGHQYFDSATGAFVIQVSKGEYGTEWWNEVERRHR